jgi:copper chaperone CopZ
MKKTTVLKVTGMTCGHCELSVQEALDVLDGVESANANHESGDVEVAYDEARVGAAEFEEAVDAAGYTLAGVENR